jgi:hypothetical protein
MYGFYKHFAFQAFLIYVTMPISNVRNGISKQMTHRAEFLPFAVKIITLNTCENNEIPLSHASDISRLSPVALQIDNMLRGPPTIT